MPTPSAARPAPETDQATETRPMDRPASSMIHTLNLKLPTPSPPFSATAALRNGPLPVFFFPTSGSSFPTDRNSIPMATYCEPFAATAERSGPALQQIHRVEEP
uniref:(northern house mosquito) hypothetical protein n=1 Tax=Culex pipiens TaxID=7175 RepID=A0A8D8PH61_CULPI